MSIARHHAEWLSLLEISGPFLSMPVLLRAFPQGLDVHDADVFRDLKQAYAEWLEDQRDPAIQTAWVYYVLNRALELPDEVIATGQAIAPSLKATIAEHGETLRPDIVIVEPASTLTPALSLEGGGGIGATPQRGRCTPVSRLVQIFGTCQGSRRGRSRHSLA